MHGDEINVTNRDTGEKHYDLPPDCQECGETDCTDCPHIINVTRKSTGEKKTYRRRKFGFRYFQNGKVSNDFIEGGIRVMTLIKASVVALIALAGVVYSVNSYLDARSAKLIAEQVSIQDKGIEERLLAIDAAYQKHLLDEATAAKEYPTRAEIMGYLVEIKADVRAIREERRR